MYIYLKQELFSNIVKIKIMYNKKISVKVKLSGNGKKDRETKQTKK